MFGAHPVSAKDKASDWPEITAEEKAMKSIPQDPEAAAVILSYTRDGKIVQKGKYMVNVLQIHWRLKVLNDRGKEYGEVHIRLGKNSRVNDLMARTIKADGTVIPVSPDQIFEKTVKRKGGGTYGEKAFNFPGVEPGAILEYRYERDSDFLYIIEPWYFAGPEITLASHVSQAVPGEASYIMMCDKCANPEPERMPWQEGKLRGRLYTFSLQDVPPYRDEFLMPPERDVSPRVEMILKKWQGQMWDELHRNDYLFADWDSVAMYTGYDYDKDTYNGQSSLKPIVAGWVQGLGDPEEKLKAVFRHIQTDFRFDYADDVYGRSASIDGLLKSKEADNEDLAVLLASALRTLGLDTRFALVAAKDKGTLYTNFFSLTQFTHAIVALPLPGGGYRWLDPTATYYPFGFLPWRDSGAGAMVIENNKAVLVNLPVETQPSGETYTVKVKPRPDGKADLEIEAEFRGDDAADMRDDLIPEAEAARAEQLGTWLQDARPGAVMRTFAIANLEALAEPLRIKMTAEAPGLVVNAEGVTAVQACALGCYSASPMSHADRRYPFYVDRGWNRKQTVTIVPPEGMRPTGLPPARAAVASLGNLNLSCTGQADGSVVCTRSFIAPRNRWPASEQNAIRTMFDKIVDIDRSSVGFTAAAPAPGK